MADEQVLERLSAHRVGPPALLGARPRLMDRAVLTALDDERVRALSVWGAVAKGDADDWSGVKFVVTVADDAVASFVTTLLEKDNHYGQSIVTLHQPQNGVAGGDFVSVTYLQSALPLQVDWYVCPFSMGLPTGDTKVLCTQDSWPTLGTTFAEMLQLHPSQETLAPPPADLQVAEIVLQAKQTVRGNPEVVLIDNVPAADRMSAYKALSKKIADLPDDYRDILPPLFNYVGVARQLEK